jgi:dipeptidyl aminopeptidase/acylaminoacyl peptidase
MRTKLVIALLFSFSLSFLPGAAAGVGSRAPAAAPAEAAGAEAGQPPLIDRELFFGDPEISGAQIAPDGALISFIKPYRGVRNIWIKTVEEPFADARPVTADTTRPVTSYFWSEDARYVLYAQDKGGNENYHVYAVDPRAESAPATGVPPARDLTPYENTRAMIYAVPESTPGEILVGINDRDPRWHDAYRLDLQTGVRTLVWRNEQDLSSYEFDLGGKLRLASRRTQDGGTEILRVDGDSLTTVYSCSVEETCYPLRFHKDGERVYLVTNKGDRDLTALVLFDPRTRQEQLVQRDPEGQVDFGGAEFSDRTEELVATYYVGDRLRIYPLTDQIKHDLELLGNELPEGEIYLGSSTEDETRILVSVQRDVDPGSVYLYDRPSGAVELLYRSRPELPSEQLAAERAIRYRARDGVEIPAYLTLPKGVAPHGLPTVIVPHGGPWGRDTWGYDPFAQLMANRGYAVLMPNFRGSAGFGKAFLNAGNGEWGTGVMQHDITDGVRYLIDQGIADPDRVGIMGGSYGGYATLAGLTFTPDLYAAGVSIVGPSNLLTLLNSIPPYWAPLKRVFNVRVGNPDDPADVARLKEQSPYFHADRIRAPLLVVQGANDPRVKQAESDQIVVAARDNGVDVAYLVAPDEGHGFRGRENRLAMIAAIEEFLAGHLGGRYQQEMPPDIAQRLAELRVDVSTVTLPDRSAPPGKNDRSGSGGAE